MNHSKLRMRAVSAMGDLVAPGPHGAKQSRVDSMAGMLSAVVIQRCFVLGRSGNYFLKASNTVRHGKRITEIGRIAVSIRCTARWLVFLAMSCIFTTEADRTGNTAVGIPSSANGDCGGLVKPF